MSLQLAAQHMASRGRGPDTTLVHMAPQEVAGLQALAKANGGSLTINPDTGLPEAGFLSSILPMLAGAALTATGVGAPLAAAMVGGGYGLATGSLRKGLMAGLGAYGGAGLAGSVLGAGTTAAQQTAMAGVDSLAGTGVGSSQGINAMDALSDAATQGLSPSAVAVKPDFNVMTGGFNVDPGLGVIPATPAPVPPTLAAQAIPTTTQAPALTQQGLLNEAAARVTPGTDLFKQAGGSYLDTAKSGFSAIMDKPELLFNKENLKYGLAAAAPLLFQEQEQEARKKEKPHDYSFSYNRVENPNAGYTGPYTGERTYFNPVYTRTAAGGGLMDIGPVEAMSNRNEAETLMANHGQMFAEGGETKAVSKVEDNPYYTMTGQSGDAFKYLMGQMPAASRAPAAEGPGVLSGNIDPTKFIAKDPSAFGLAPTMSSGISGNGLNQYTFDPVTGTFTAMPASALETKNPTSSAYYGTLGGDTGYGFGGGSETPSSPADYGSGFSAANASDFGGYFAHGGIASLARGGMSHLGDYSDGGRLLRGPGDGVSDSIPASIGNKRPARLADGEFVVPARIVSELGNGSTEAGARKLYAMMDRVQKARGKTVGKGRVAVNSKAEKMLPA